MKLIYIILIGVLLIGVLLYLNKQGAKASEKKEIEDAARDLISPEKKTLVTTYTTYRKCKKNYTGAKFKLRRVGFANTRWGDCTYYK